LGRGNTEADVDFVVDCFTAAANRLRKLILA